MLARLAGKALFPLYLLTSFCILVLMGVSFADVILRSLNRPIRGAYEITEIAVGAMVFAALPLVTLRREHVQVTLFSGLADRHWWLRLLFTVVGKVIALAVFGFFAWQLYRLGNQMNASGARAIFAGFPLAPFAWFAALMCLLSAVAALLAPPGSASDVQGDL
ncbi:TRAP transporter small permease [Oceaniglobus ichthyenteri]|uniref:TRAP transporter small permease n=1 Tax=Oceaniglobus ichthyenteri TaxID=2136177 RepID=UPI000D35574F|nr:TRAP transporter small permease subunit [Oceaniglobus ichthyenteri]